jgi:hypothetical protein
MMMKGDRKELELGQVGAEGGTDGRHAKIEPPDQDEPRGAEGHRDGRPDRQQEDEEAEEPYSLTRGDASGSIVLVVGSLGCRIQSE